MGMGGNIYIGSMSESAPQDDPKLVIKLDNKKPIPLYDFAMFLHAWEDQYEAYLESGWEQVANRKVKLYVKEVRKGSTIIDLVPMLPEVAGIAAIPFLENATSVVRFAERMATTIKRFLSKEEKDHPLTITNKDLKDINKIMNPVAMDHGANLFIETHIHGNVDVHIELPSIEANAIQNMVRSLTKEPLPPPEGGGVQSRVILSWHQMNESLKNMSTNLAYIDSIAKGAKNVLFDDEDLKKQMVLDDPFNKLFVVDAEPLTTQGKIVAFRVSRIHETLPKPPKDDE